LAILCCQKATKPPNLRTPAGKQTLLGTDSEIFTRQAETGENQGKTSEPQNKDKLNGDFHLQ